MSPGVFAQAPVVLWLPWRGLAEKGGWGLGWPDGLFCSLKRPVSACRMACFASLNSLFLQVPGHQRLMPEAKAVADAHEKAPHGAGLCMHGLWRWTCGGCRRGWADCRQAACGSLLQPVGEPLQVGDCYLPAPLLYEACVAHGPESVGHVEAAVVHLGRQAFHEYAYLLAASGRKAAR